ncbi:type VI secretion protein [Aliidongia dinghuensis]|uniref:Type VI secretion protein n=1 Tax=Aliidongia dinghuensis TaxID=1867774 RepID=A0A8J2YZ54_9PROT|nr:type VI secretion protein [Aliidongia dinghuensis]
MTPQSLYFRLRDARSEGRAQERIADNDPTATDDGFRHWTAVRELAIAALAAETKDLEIAAWLTESLVRCDGLAGLVVGAELLRGLVERFWERNLFPPPDEDGLEGRLAPIAGLDGEGGNGALLQPLRKLVMFERGDGTPVSFWQFEQSEDVAALADTARKNQRLAAGVPPFAELEAEARGAGRPMLAAMVADAAHAIAAWRALKTALDAAAGRDAPALGRVLDLLNKLHRVAARYAGLPAAAVEATAVEAIQAADVPVVHVQAAEAQPDREALLAELSRIAALFRKTEPNSPISYTLEEAIRRARLTLPELLKEMMPDAAPRAALLVGLGINATLE